MIHRFADVEIDVAGHEIRRSNTVVDVQPQVFGVLVHLIEHHDRVVGKTELLDAVWTHRFVTESALTSRIKSARQVIGDNGRDQRMIRTVHGRGYRFVATLEAGESVPPSSATAILAAGSSDSVTADGEPGAVLVTSVLDRLVQGRGSAVVVTGGSGSGKTAVLEQLRDRAVVAGHAAGFGSARHAALRMYGCVIDAVDEMMHRDPALLDDLPPGCRTELAEVLAGGVPSARQRWHLSVRELLVHTARRHGGVVMILDDMHLADSETWALVAHVSRLAERHAVVVVLATSAENEPTPGFDVVRLPTAAALTPIDDESSPPGGPSDLPADVVASLQVLSLVDGPFDLTTVGTALDTDPSTADRLIAVARDAQIIEEAGEGRFRFTNAGRARALGFDGADHRRVATHALLGRRFALADADPRRIAHHLLEGGEPESAVPAVLAVARDASRAEFHHDALEWTARVLDHVADGERFAVLALRAESLAAVGDPTAVVTYREALRVASHDDAPGLRAGLARVEMLAGNIEAASEALEGLEADGGPHDGAIWLAQGMLSYFLGDLDASERATDAARGLALAPGSPTRLLDVIALQGMISHNRGTWSDRLYRELRNPGQTPDIVATVFDSHLCVAEYMLYGPTPYDEVVALADNLRRNADELGARRAVAFAVCVAGEAEFLAGHLERAEELLEESVALHRELVADTGLAHSLQRLAEVRLASGDRDAAERLGREALVLARWSPLSRHILQRTYGTLIAAAPDLSSALAAVDEAAQVLDGPTSCMFCQVMIAVPSAIACAAGGRLEEARRHLLAAEMSAMAWEGTAWQGAVTEARACLVRAEGDESGANRLLATAAELFERAGQPIDAERCRDASTL